MPRANRNQETVLYPPYAKDIRNLLLDYLLKKSSSFSEFKEVWKKHSFSLIFEGRPDDVDPKLYIQELYNTCLGYLLFNNPNELRIAIVYTLYLLYSTQPQTPKCKINTSLELYEEMCKLEVLCRDAKNIEGFQIIQNLKKCQAFNYTASVRIDPLLSSLVAPQETSDEIPIEIREANTVNGIKFRDLEDHFAKYKEAKSKVFDQSIFLPEYNIVSELRTVEEKHINEKEIRKDNLNIELFLNVEKKPARKRSTTPRKQTKRKSKVVVEVDDDDDSLEQFENEIGADVVVEKVREKRKRNPRTIEPISLQLINNSIDDFLSPSAKTEAKRMEAKKVEDDTENPVVMTIKNNPRARKQVQRYGVVQKQEDVIEEELN
jgi:hypothetical protein